MKKALFVLFFVAGLAGTAFSWLKSKLPGWVFYSPKEETYIHVVDL